jgi:hypothetical protein
VAPLEPKRKPAKLELEQGWTPTQILSERFVHGAIDQRSADELAEAQIVTSADANALVALQESLDRLLASAGPHYKDLWASRCFLAVREGGVDVKCSRLARCLGLHKGGFYDAELRLEHGRFAVVRTRYEERKDRNACEPDI